MALMLETFRVSNFPVLMAVLAFPCRLMRRTSSPTFKHPEAGVDDSVAVVAVVAVTE